MAGRSRNWDSLSPDYRGRLSRSGITKTQYESGAKLTRARGHAKTPEHPREAQRRPERYPEYRARKAASDLARARDNAQRNLDRLFGDYFSYNRKNVIGRVYGGELKGETLPGMTLAQANWTAQADSEEIRSRASEQLKGNPWWYH